MIKETLTLKDIIIGIVVVFALITIINSISFVKTGEIGIVTQFGAVKDRVMTAGLNFKVPYIQGVKKINCKTQEMTIDNLDGATKDLQDVVAKVSINYSVNVDQAPNLYKTVGKDYKDVILTPALMDTIKSSISEFTAEESIVKRAELASKIYEKINQRLNEQGINITNVNILDLNFSEAFDQAIEEKQIATQRTLKAQQELETAKVEAEKKKVEAEGVAEANRIINESLSDQNLQKQFLDKWNGNLPTYMGGELPIFFNIGQ